jgi:hypothetical protein
MPVPIPGLKVESDHQKAKFLTIFSRPKTGIFREFGGVPGGAPLATNHAAVSRCSNYICFSSKMTPRALGPKLSCFRNANVLLHYYKKASHHNNRALGHALAGLAPGADLM